MTTQIRKYNKSKPGTAQATVTSQQVSNAIADLSGYLTREEFERYFELVNVGSEESPVTAIHALYAGLYSDGFVSGFGPGADAGSAWGGGGLDEAELAAYLTDHAYATQAWVLGKHYLKEADLEKYVTLDTAQTITGAKTFTAPVTAASFVKAGGTSAQVLMADGSVQTHWKAADVTSATSDDGMITPLAMRKWTASQYQPKGNYVTLDTEQTISAAKTFSALVTLNAGVKIGQTVISYDAELNAVKVEGNIYATGFLSGFGPGASDGEGAGSGVTALSLLTDVQLTSPVSGQALVYNGSKWVNQTVSAGVGPAAMDHITPKKLISESLAMTVTDTMAYYGDGQNASPDKPAGVAAFGMLTLRAADGWSGEILMSSNMATGLYWRVGNTLSGGWRTILDSVNYTSTLDNRYVTLNTEQEISGAKTFTTGAWVLKSIESNEIKDVGYNNNTIGQGGGWNFASIRHGIDFRWYNTHWVIGNIRGSSANTSGFGIGLLNEEDKLDLGLRVTTSKVFAKGYATFNGTSSQFLMADGSVDSNSYALSSALGNYLPLSGGTLTGNLTIGSNLIIGGDGQYMLGYKPASGFTGVSNTQWGVGSIQAQGVIRSSDTDLIHYRNGNATAARVILDSANYSAYITKSYVNGLNVNAATATKLQTARTIWGQSFDGGGNVNGRFTQDVAAANFTENAWFGSSNLGENQLCNIVFGKEKSRGNSGTFGHKHIADGSNQNMIVFGGYNFDNLLCIRYDGNVGIGTTSPTYKLDVNGIIHSNNRFRRSGYAGASWDGGYGAFEVEIVNNTSQTPLLVALREGVTSYMGANNADRLFAMELFNGSGDLRFSFSGAKKFEMRSNGQFEVTSSVKIGSATLTYDASTDMIKCDKGFYSDGTITGFGTGSSTGAAGSLQYFTEQQFYENAIGIGTLNSLVPTTLIGCIGTTAKPLRMLYTKEIMGLTDITAANYWPKVSGSSALGGTGDRFGVGYINDLYINRLFVNGTQITSFGGGTAGGTKLSISGSTLSLKNASDTVLSSVTLPTAGGALPLSGGTMTGKITTPVADEILGNSYLNLNASQYNPNMRFTLSGVNYYVQAYYNDTRGPGLYLGGSSANAVKIDQNGNIYIPSSAKIYRGTTAIL